MLKLILSVLMLGIGLISYAQINIPALSPEIEIKQKIGLTNANINYSRPSLRGRSLFGVQGILILNEKWRTGANAVTRIAFDKDVLINGKKLLKGAYALLSTPAKDKWTLHFYTYDKRPFTYFLDKEAVLELSAPIERISFSQESFLLLFEEISLHSAKLVLRWSDYQVSYPIQLEEHQSILANIKKVLSGPSDFDYFQAALYLHETQTDLPLALSYIQKVTESDEALFFQVFREALILQDLRRWNEAVLAATRAKALSLKAGNDDLARLSQKIIDESEFQRK